MRLFRDSPVPLYQQLLKEVRSRIVTGEWAVGSRLPNELDLASELGVSRMTVRQALSAAVDAGLLVRMRGKGTFVAHGVEQAEMRGFVGHVVPFLSHSFDTRMLLGVESVLKVEGYRLVFSNSEGDIHAEQQMLQQLEAEGMLGCIVEPVDGQDDVLTQWVTRRYPVVLLDRSPEGLQADLVASDHFRGGYTIVQHLIDQGLTDIVYLAADPLHLSSITERRAGYLSAMANAGLHAREPFVIEGICERGQFADITSFIQEEAAAVERIADWLRSPERPEAIVAANDLFALLVLAAAQRSGLRVPDDIAVTGFDDVDFAATCEPPLTTVAQPAFQLGVEAARLLLRRLAGSGGPAQQLRLPTKLVIRQSSRRAPREPPVHVTKRQFVSP
jgi:DNA-binding LacI/PurR family transcriptional regulator